MFYIINIYIVFLVNYEEKRKLRIFATYAILLNWFPEWSHGATADVTHLLGWLEIPSEDLLPCQTLLGH
jgi:hypothetical protein